MTKRLDDGSNPVPSSGASGANCLSREFAFLRRETAVSGGCRGRGERRGRERRAGRGNIGPTGGKRIAEPEVRIHFPPAASLSQQ
jgi:hypothetical protein